MDTKSQYELRAGIFVLIALFLIGFTVFVMGRERQIFASQEEYFASFKDILGLAPGAPIRLGGISIGRVDRVSFAKEPDDPNVHVILLINEAYLEKIRIDSIVTIETQGLLGDRFINISTGKDKNLLPPGSFLNTKEASDFGEILTKAGTIIDNTVEIAERINAVLGKVQGDTLDNFAKSLASVAKISEEIEKGDGLVHKLVYSKKEGEEVMKSLTGASEDLRVIIDEVRNGKGLLHGLIFEPIGQDAISSLATAATKLAESASAISMLANDVKTGKGLAHDLIYGESPQGLDQILKNLSEAAANILSASQALAYGSGTLGALLIDSKLYDNLIEVTDGAKRSFILRQAIRSSLKE